MSKVNILLSTYNGSKYLSEQLDSLLSQEFKNVRLHIRDDGSTDCTRIILESYASKSDIIELVCNKNIGVVKSYFELLSNANADCSYFAFCDQDDVWLKEKVSSAIKQMETSDSEIPLLYFSRVEFVDDTLKHVGFSAIPQKTTFEHALVENLATGCTIVINKCARNLILSRLPEVSLMHDWWMFLVISAFGKVIYDSESKILYRQHSANVVGGTTDRFTTNLKKIIPFLKSAVDPAKKRTSDQVSEFMRLYGEKLDAHQIRFIDDFLNAKSSILQRLIIVASGKYRRQDFVDNVVFSALIILGYY